MGTMGHLNQSPFMNSDNYYDVSIGRAYSSQNLSTKKKYPSVYTPKRATSLASLMTLGETKRPGDYYIQKLSNSSVNLPLQTNGSLPSSKVRPTSANSIISLPSTCSDDASLIGSSQFDPHDSRLSSMTSNSIVSPLDSPSLNNYSFVANQTSKIKEENEIESEKDDSLEHLNSSVSTITLQSNNLKSKTSASDLSNAQPPRKPLMKMASTPAIAKRQPPIRSASSGSMGSLVRTKTKFLNPKEKKERLEKRKKQYEENDNDDDLLENDLNLVCNVPVIKGHAEMYFNNKSTSCLLSRNDLLSSSDDNKYNINNNSSGSLKSIKPCPLPGKLGSQTDLTFGPKDSSLHVDSIEEENEENQTFVSDGDIEITNNISSFYEDCTSSFSLMLRNSRARDIGIKLPKYIRSQSSLEDLQLVSPEKLNIVDQTRPINLPPKASLDKSKHYKEFQKKLTDYESVTRLQNEQRIKSIGSLLSGHKHWLSLAVCDDKDLLKKTSSEKLTIRKLGWESLSTNKIRFDLFYKLMSFLVESRTLEKINSSFDEYVAKYEAFDDAIKVTKGHEFDATISSLLNKPLYSSIIQELNEDLQIDFDKSQFRKNFKYLLFIKSLSEDGLRKHDETFLVPLFLILFQDKQTLKEIYVLTELYNQQVFDEEFSDSLNKSLKLWSLGASLSKYLNRFLKRFGELGEFEDLSSNAMFEILLQINDKLPLSLSAPSTPIANHISFFPSSPLVPQSSESSDSTRSTSTDSNEISGTRWINSSALNLMIMFVQLLVIYSTSTKTKRKNNLRLMQSFLMVIFKYYHINWNTVADLIKHNKSIKLNNSVEQAVNLNSFMDKWKMVFENM